MCRSRKGAWIEISSNYENQGTQGVVAPVRERGLKWLLRAKQGKMRRRSREGAWIEIRNMVGFSVLLTQITHSD